MNASKISLNNWVLIVEYPPMKVVSSANSTCLTTLTPPVIIIPAKFPVSISLFNFLLSDYSIIIYKKGEKRASLSDSPRGLKEIYLHTIFQMGNPWYPHNVVFNPFDKWER